MKQKLALACTLIHSPPTILLDEPTAGVDPVSRREFWRILYGINRSGTTIFVSTPYMDEAERAHRVAFITRGSMVSCGTPAELKEGLQGDVVEIVCAERGTRGVRCATSRSCAASRSSARRYTPSLPRRPTAMPHMQARSEDAGIEGVRLREIPPSLEDTFVARLTA